MKAKWLNRNLIVGPYVTLCTTEAQYQYEMRRLDIKSPGPWIGNAQSDATTHEMRNSKGEQVFIVCLGDCSEVEGIQIAALLVHEAVHVVQSFFESIGEDRPSSEFEAYAVQHVSQQLMYEYARQCPV